MRVIKTRAELQHKSQFGFIPTMGALHEGHLSLVRCAQAECKQTCISIFVNPLQFGPNEDFSKYPRTIEADLDLLEKAGVDIVYLPELEDIYPEFSGAAPTLVKIDTETQLEKITANPELANKLCGRSRPGHFDGVCTVVKRLFDIVQPQRAYFGEKDYQQLMIIQEMVKRLGLGIEIVPCAIMREADGLAMSSRNRYLSASERKLAPMLYEELSKLSQIQELQAQVKKAEPAIIERASLAGDFATIPDQVLEESRDRLSKAGFEVDYLEVQWGRVFVAGRLGTTRLIDNIYLPLYNTCSAF